MTTPLPSDKSRYIVLNKPYGVLSQFTPELEGQRTLAEFGLPKELYAAGRLDLDSEGLLLLTNDGPMIKLLLKPGSHDRTYLAQVEGLPTKESLERLSNGLRLENYQTLPAVAELRENLDIKDRKPPIRVRQSIPTSWIELTIREGKNRQVRKMTAAVGFPTLRLIRVAIATLHIGDLTEGAWRDLQPDELAKLKRSIADASFVLKKKRPF